jgi:hypothetical protein
MLVTTKSEGLFDGGHVTSDAGVVLLRQFDRRVRLTSRLAGMLDDPRRGG